MFFVEGEWLVRIMNSVNFDDYEAGYKELANEIYDYLPEEEREAALLIFIRTMLLY